MYGPDRMRMLNRLKRSFDPDGLLGPGNILTPEEEISRED